VKHELLRGKRSARGRLNLQRALALLGVVCVRIGACNGTTKSISGENQPNLSAAVPKVRPTDVAHDAIEI
jgi:hypothetical protein